MKTRKVYFWIIIYLFSLLINNSLYSDYLAPKSQEDIYQCVKEYNSSEVLKAIPPRKLDSIFDVLKGTSQSIKHLWNLAKAEPLSDGINSKVVHFHGLYLWKGRVYRDDQENKIIYEFDPSFNFASGAVPSIGDALTVNDFTDSPFLQRQTIAAWRGIDLESFPPSRIFVKSNDPDAIEKIKTKLGFLVRRGVQIEMYSPDKVDESKYYHSRNINFLEDAVNYRHLLPRLELFSWQMLQKDILDGKQISPQQTRLLRKAIGILVKWSNNLFKDQYTGQITSPLHLSAQELIDISL